MQQRLALPQALPVRAHGGPDAQGAARFDFSTNRNSCGPCPAVLAVVQAADASSYPDSRYTALRRQLAAWHGVDADRIVLAASASEFIFRVTGWVARMGGHSVCLPPYSYGDYAQAAAAWGLTTVRDTRQAQLVWACEPSSPLGGAHQDWTRGDPQQAIAVLDCAYAPLRLSGASSLVKKDQQAWWQLFSPNKALGLTGVRAAYAIAPPDASAAADALNAMCPSWPLGAHGVALLSAWTDAGVQRWLAASLETLRHDKARQTLLCTGFGWEVLPSEANFFVCRVASASLVVKNFRQHGIGLRDCASFRLPGHLRLGVLGLEAQAALEAAWQHTVESRNLEEPPCLPKP